MLLSDRLCYFVKSIIALSAGHFEYFFTFSENNYACLKTYDYVNLKTRDLVLAKEIAKKVRFKDGGFPHLRAMGVDLKDKRMVQVSMNLTKYRETNIPKVKEFIKEEASQRGVEVEGSEIVGLIPLEVLVDIARYYLKYTEFSIRQVIEQRIIEFE